MSGCYLNEKKVEKLRRKYNLPDIYKAAIGNGDHFLYLFLKDGSSLIVKNGELEKASPWRFHTSDFNKPLPIEDNLITKP